MFRITPSDLRKKTDWQLSQLFNLVQKGSASPAAAPLAQKNLQSALSLIQRELARRMSLK